MRRTLAALLRNTLGRRRLGRAGRFLLNASRFDGDGDPRSNGEYRYLESVISAALDRKGHCMVFDVGANVGSFTKHASSVIGGRGRIHAVEACHATFRTLCGEVSRLSTPVEPLHAAFSDRNGTGTMFVHGPGLGINSLVSRVSPEPTIEPVELLRLDSFAATRRIGEIDFLKIDVEGHDLSVLRGCGTMLRGGSIKAIQFEYNWRWIDQRSLLRDVFDLIAEFPDYSLGKVTCDGIEFYDSWAPSLETLEQSNYAILHQDYRDCVELARKMPIRT